MSLVGQTETNATSDVPSALMLTSDARGENAHIGAKRFVIGANSDTASSMRLVRNVPKGDIAELCAARRCAALPELMSGSTHNRRNQFVCPSISGTPSSAGSHARLRLVQICRAGRPRASRGVKAPVLNV